jgi:hypothetical protein
MQAAQYKVHAKFPGQVISHGSYECKDIDEIHDIMFIVAENNGKITWIGEKHYIGATPNGKNMMYEYREIREAYK